MIIAIDGPAASGKGTLGKRLAAQYGLRHLDTGLIYRAVAKAMLDAGHSPGNRARAVAAAEAIDLARFDEPALKSQAVGEAASLVSAVPEVRGALLAFQRKFGRTPPGAVIDGRDIGTALFPMPTWESSMTATPEVRASQRFAEPRAPASAVSEADVLADIQRRDERDTTRAATSAGRARRPLARYHAFGYRRGVPGRHRHCRSRPSRPGRG
jgi:cytidylate kinase